MTNQDQQILDSINRNLPPGLHAVQYGERDRSDWTRNLARNLNSTIKANLANTMIALRGAPEPHNCSRTLTAGSGTFKWRDLGASP